jgi:phospholipid/cholesterol/gamma-HCH transport system substrate-binding protein
METRANFVLIGGFTLAVIASAFAFIFWFQHQGTASSRVQYKIVFDGPVAGLRTGASVNFNGIRVGEVQSVKLDDPVKVVALLSIEKQTPIRQDTQAGLEFAGLTGVAAVALTGGRPDSPEIVPGDDGIPTMNAELGSSQDMTESARAVLQNLNRVVLDNQEAISATMKSIQVFSATLSKNSDRIDTIMAGLEGMVGKDGKGDLPMAIHSFRELADNLDTRTADISSSVVKLTSSAQKDFSALVADGRRTLADLDRAVNNFDRNPSRVLFGGSSSSAPAPAPAPAAPEAAPRPPRRPAPAPAAAQ